MNDAELYRHEGWQWCTAEGAELHTLLQGLRSSFREKLEWLEEAEILTLRLHGQPEGLVAEEAGRYDAQADRRAKEDGGACGAVMS